MSKFDTPTIESRQPCGCVTTTTEIKGQEPMVNYEPCLACALNNAGVMLIEAAKRLAEAAEREAEEMAENAEAARKQAEDFIGGGD